MTEAAAAQAGTEQGQQGTQSNEQGSQGQQPSNQQAEQPWYGSDLTPEDKQYLESKAWTGKDGPQKIFQSYKNAEKMISQIKGDPNRILVMPKDMTNKEEVSAFYEKLGVPKDPKEYGLDMEAEDSKVFADIFQSKGVSKEAGQELIKTVRELAEKRQAAAEEQWVNNSATELADWKKELGPKADEVIQTAKTAYNMFPELKEHSGAIERAMGTKAYMAFMASLGGKVGEASAPGINPSTVASGGMTRESALQAIRQMQNDPAKRAILGDSGNPAYQSTIAEWKRLHEIAYKE